MANTVNITLIADSDRYVVGRAYFASDGVAGELTAQVLIDASSLTPVPVNLRLTHVYWSFTGFQADLFWDQTSNDPIIHLPGGSLALDTSIAEEFDFSRFGGIPNDPSAAGYTGDLIMTTAGFATLGDVGSLILVCTKQ